MFPGHPRKAENIRRPDCQEHTAIRAQFHLNAEQHQYIINIFFTKNLPSSRDAPQTRPQQSWPEALTGLLPAAVALNVPQTHSQKPLPEPTETGKTDQSADSA